MIDSSITVMVLSVTRQVRGILMNKPSCPLAKRGSSIHFIRELFSAKQWNCPIHSPMGKSAIKIWLRVSCIESNLCLSALWCWNYVLQLTHCPTEWVGEFLMKSVSALQSELSCVQFVRSANGNRRSGNHAHNWLTLRPIHSRRCNSRNRVINKTLSSWANTLS